MTFKNKEIVNYSSNYPNHYSNDDSPKLENKQFSTYSNQSFSDLIYLDINFVQVPTQQYFNIK